MKALVLIAAMVLGTAAKADGFVCHTHDGITVKVYNRTSGDEGTRNSAVMVLSDANVSEGSKTIASFKADNSLLTNESSTYTAKVDLRFSDSNLAGRNLLGTKLGNVEMIVLAVDFSYSRPLPDGAPVKGELNLTRRNGGDDIRVDVACTRYLKGE